MTSGDWDLCAYKGGDPPRSFSDLAPWCHEQRNECFLSDHYFHERDFFLQGNSFETQQILVGLLPFGSMNLVDHVRSFLGPHYLIPCHYCNYLHWELHSVTPIDYGFPVLTCSQTSSSTMGCKHMWYSIFLTGIQVSSSNTAILWLFTRILAISSFSWWRRRCISASRSLALNPWG